MPRSSQCHQEAIRWPESLWQLREEGLVPASWKVTPAPNWWLHDDTRDKWQSQIMPLLLSPAELTHCPFLHLCLHWFPVHALLKMLFFLSSISMDKTHSPVLTAGKLQLGYWSLTSFHQSAKTRKPYMYIQIYVINVCFNHWSNVLVVLNNTYCFKPLWNQTHMVAYCLFHICCGWPTGMR